jgi:SAM-dependent methyltransferase
MSRSGYDAQARGDQDSYARYLRGMDASMRQKVALTAAHLLCEGKVADMGMGSGSGSHALAALYSRLEVVGVDIDPTIVELARRTHSLPNLSFQQGDISGPVFPAGSLDGIFDSSVLHHVTSYGGYRHENAAAALAAQAAQLKPHGVLVVRDFLDPGPGQVLLDLPADDGQDSDSPDPPSASTAALLERFAREFRSLSPVPGFACERTRGAGPGGPPLRPGWRRYRLGRKHAAEFLLRKDYRADWQTEVQEEYTYFTQPAFEALFARLGLRVLASTAVWNPWIVHNRFEGQCALWSEEGLALPFPATNYVIVGERVPPDEGVAFQVAASLDPPRGFLRLEHHREVDTGRIYDVAARPHPTVDIVPFFRAGGTVYVLARTSYPRPILRAGHQDCLPLDGSGPADYVAEPLNVLQTDAPLGQTVEEALDRTASIAPRAIRRMLTGTTYYPSPGGILEEVRSVLVEIDPVFVNSPLPGLSGFSSSGRIRAIEARQLLRSAQVGGLPDARLELNVHDLLLRLGVDRGPWIGDQLALGQAMRATTTALDEALARPGRRRFERTAEAGAPFLEVRASRFEELAADGRVLDAATLEYVVPVAPLGLNTVATALLARGPDDGVLLGLDEDDLPAAQSFAGVSNLLVTPAWRIPRRVGALGEARAFVAARLHAEYGVTVDRAWELGGPYRPSAGLTPEIVYPLAFGVASVAAGHRPLLWIPIDQLVAQRQRVPDGHLRVVVLRASHALSAAGQAPP